MSKVRGVSAASSQIRFGLPPNSIWLLPTHVCENMERPGEHGSPESAAERACDLIPLTLFFSRMWACDETLSLTESTWQPSGWEERITVSVIGKQFALLLCNLSFLLGAAGNPQGCFLFKHKEALRGTWSKQIRLGGSDGSNDNIALKKGGEMIMKAFDILKASACLESRMNGSLWLPRRHSHYKSPRRYIL